MPKRTDIHSVLIIGAGPIIIGQACEFDYSGTQACKALREEGYRVVLVNSNPATIMTDPEFADRTYIEPITPEAVEKIIIQEKDEMRRMGVPVGPSTAGAATSETPHKLVLLPTLGGQTALNTAMALHRKGVLEKHGIEMIGAKAEAIHKGEDRLAFKELMLSIGLDVPISGVAHDLNESLAIAERIGRFPLIIRPAFTLGGTGGGIAYNRDEFEEIAKRGMDLSPVNEILIEESLLGWKEYEMEVMRDKADNCVIVCSIENFDPMGVHTGDSITVARADARAALVELAQFMERNYTDAHRYDLDRAGAAINTAALPFQESPIEGGTKFYDLALVAAQNTFTLSAAPKNGQATDPCGTLSLDQAGVKDVAGGTLPKADCW
jgi:carbamoyl-phosphate synthase large subunit